MLADICFKAYIERIEENLDLNIKALCRYTKCKRITNRVPSSLHFGERVGNTGMDIANLFADCSSSVYSSGISGSYFPDFQPSNSSTTILDVENESC